MSKCDKCGKFISYKLFENTEDNKYCFPVYCRKCTFYLEKTGNIIMQALRKYPRFIVKRESINDN